MQKLIIDMVHHNPGEQKTYSKFLDQQTLANAGYNGQVWFDYIQTAISYESIDEDIIKDNPALANAIWAGASNIRGRIGVNKQNDMLSLFHTDFIVIPKDLKAKYHDELCNAEGRIDIHKPFTQKIIRVQINEIFNRFPGMDGLVIRHGETYTHDIPLFVGNGPISQGLESHKLFINLLREEICEKRNKLMVYRTWDFQGLHTNVNQYLEVTDAIEPHPKLYFSIKHTNGDYWRAVSFNPCLMKGKHQQLVEIQCQREYEGKGSHPNYIAHGVINGFEELSKLMNKNAARCLEDIKNNQNFGGVYTWSRGGGWNGPYIMNELWTEINARVITKWTNEPDQPEENHFYAVCQDLGINSDDALKLRDILLNSLDAILRGQFAYESLFDLYQRQIQESTSQRAYCIEDGIEILWTRDQYIGGSNQVKNTLKSLREQNKIREFLKEKEKAVEIWKTIVSTAKKMKLEDKPDLKKFIQSSCMHGLLKFRIFYQSWKLLVWDEVEISENQREEISNDIRDYHLVWQEYNELNKPGSIPSSNLYQSNYCNYVSQKGMFPGPGISDYVKSLEAQLTNTDSG